MAELRAVSTRARITRSRFVNEYHFGDFRGDTRKLMSKYFDAHRYFASWGSHRLMLRLPRARVDVAMLKPYFASSISAAMKVSGNYVVLDFHVVDEREFEGDSSVSLTTLAKLRDELIAGDLRSAYLAWLVGLENGDYKDGSREPALPRGFPKWTRAQSALIRFLGISPHILDATSRVPRHDGKKRTAGQLLQEAQIVRASAR